MAMEEEEHSECKGGDKGSTCAERCTTAMVATSKGKSFPPAAFQLDQRGVQKAPGHFTWPNCDPEDCRFWIQMFHLRLTNERSSSINRVNIILWHRYLLGILGFWTSSKLGNIATPPENVSSMKLMIKTCMYWGQYVGCSDWINDMLLVKFLFLYFLIL